MRPNYAAGVFASVLLVPIMVLRGDGGDLARPEFDLSDAPPATWLEPSRVVSEETTTTVTVTPAKVTSTTSASGGLVAAPAAPSTRAPAPAAAPTAPSAPASSTTTVATSPPTPTTVRPVPPSTTAVPTTVAVVLPIVGPVTPAQKPFGSHSARGVASWFNAPDGTCAHVTIPKGTVVRVTRLQNGAVTTCIVNDWGPADTSRIIDLSMDTFEKLASAEAGLIDVLIEW